MIAPASRKLGKYEILQKLGRGGMADVYLAQDTVHRYKMALKLIEHADDIDTRDAIDAERRGSALQVHLAAIDPRVVRIYEVGDVDGFFYVAMEYIEGHDLSEWMRKGPLNLEFALDVAIGVAQTLENAHNLQVAIDGKDYHGIVHGDIKPKNIRIDVRGEPRVLDFGIAKALSLSRRVTRNDFGSIPYGSPERLELGTVNELSDLWSLAVMLYEMVTGMQPYHAETTERLESMIRSRIPPPPPPDPCPEPLRQILIKAMAPQEELRYQTAHDLLQDLVAFRKGEPVVVDVVEEDPDATRRTTRRETSSRESSEVDEDTRRTVKAPPAADNGDETRRTSQTWPPKKPKKPMSVEARRAVAGAGMLLLAMVSWGAISSAMLYHRGQQLANQISAEEINDPTEIWNRWTELSKGNSSSVLLATPRKLVKERLVAAADHVIDNSRNTDSVYEAAWKGAREELSHALLVDPDDTVRGKLRLTEGHLARINGTAHSNAAELNDAVEKFTEAEHLMPKSPDPQLGLARVYVYGLKDIDKAYRALQEAERRGFPLGKREKAELADGYTDRADRLFQDSEGVRGLPQEKDQIRLAKADYERAMELYQEIAPYKKANIQIVKVQHGLDNVEVRLQEIEGGGEGEGKTENHGLGALKKIPALVDTLKKIWH